MRHIAITALQSHHSNWETDLLSDDLRQRSRALTEGPNRAPARAMMKAIGFTDEDLRRPLVGVAHCWIGVMPCNFNHRRLAAKAIAAGESLNSFCVKTLGKA